MSLIFFNSKYKNIDYKMTLCPSVITIVIVISLKRSVYAVFNT